MAQKRLFSDEINHHLVAALTGDRGAYAALVPQLEPRLRRCLKRVLRAWPEDLIEDVISEFWAGILTSAASGQYEPSRAAPSTFALYLLREAVRRVRASYCPPGVRTRAFEAKQIEKQPMVTANVSLSDPAVEFVPAAGPGSASAIEAHCELRAVLELAPAWLVQGLAANIIEGASLTEAAQALGTSRFVLQRQWKALVERVVRAA